MAERALPPSPDNLPARQPQAAEAPPGARCLKVIALVVGALVVLVGAADASARTARVLFGSEQSAATIAFRPVVATDPGIEETLAADVVARAPLVPARLRIPSLGIDAKVEQVGRKQDGTMGTPAGIANVAWYALGAKPGSAGSAVFAGHVNNARTQGGVFEHLSRLRVGSYVTVTDQSGRSLVYEVAEIATYPWDEAPAAAIFAAEGPSRLVLITCEGDWLPSERTFDRRLVVFAKLA